MNTTIKDDRSIREVAQSNYFSQEYINRKTGRKWARRVETTIYWIMAGLIVFILFGAYLTNL